MARARILLLSLLLAFTVPTLAARDVFVMLSGGVSPWINNYSQYLQARAVVTWLEQNYPHDSVWSFFGAGNVAGAEPVFCDVRREEIRDGQSAETWLAGSLSRNRPARRDVFLQVLREEILPAVADGGTLYLFVGDHGSQSRGTNAESIIDLWGLERDETHEHGWRTQRNSSLRVSDLREALTKGLGKGRVVFCMTQCHSGGFHHLGVPRAVTPNARWFVKEPSWLAALPTNAPLPRAAGFTATDERSLAAGCQADPDYLRWAGYERYVPQVLFGWDLFELKSNAKGLRSFADAHEAATLMDQTIDKPYSSSEQYLERWASFIETRLMRETNNLAPRVERQLAAYRRTVDGAAPKELNLLFRQRQALFRRFTDQLTEQNSAAAKLLLTGTRAELEEAAGLSRRPRTNTTARAGTTNSTGRPRGTGTATNTTSRTSTNATARAATNAPTETQKQWQIIRPAWSDAVESGRAASVVGAAAEFEKFLLREEAKGRDNFSSTSRARLREEAFWQAGYSTPRTLDLKTAEAVLRWSTDRRSNITAWARSSPEEEIRAAAEKLLARNAPRTNTSSTLTNTVAAVRTNAPVTTAFTPRISRRIAAERVLFYRRTLAAWEFLLALNERPALAQVKALTELERTPLPAR